MSSARRGERWWRDLKSVRVKLANQSAGRKAENVHYGGRVGVCVGGVRPRPNNNARTQWESYGLDSEDGSLLNIDWLCTSVYKTQDNAKWEPRPSAHGESYSASAAAGGEKAAHTQKKDVAQNRKESR